eukprot:73563_1
MATEEEKEPLTKQNPNVPSTTQKVVSNAVQSTQKEVQLDPSIKAVTCGIAWDFFDKKIDLDVTVVALDTYSFEMDVAYYNQLSILDGSIVHSGDEKSGIAKGDNEQIKIHLTNLPQRCRSLWFIVNAFETGDFTDVETAQFTLYEGNDLSKRLYSYGIGMAFKSTAILIGALSVDDPYSDQKRWSFKMIEARGRGRNFVESKYILLKNLNLLYDDAILMERPRDRNQKYDLKKGDLYVVHPNIVNLSVGLGWDSSSRSDVDIDVDASVIIFNKTYETTDIVYFGMKDYVGAVVHGGDNLTGAGEGDDEVIKINLDKLDANEEADVLCAVINVYSDGCSFRNVTNCFVRLMADTNQELCRFNLSGGYNTPAMVMCHLNKRENGCWALVTDGIGCGGNTAKKSVGYARNIIMGTVSASVNTLVYQAQQFVREHHYGDMSDICDFVWESPKQKPDKFKPKYALGKETNTDDRLVNVDPPTHSGDGCSCCSIL